MCVSVFVCATTTMPHSSNICLRPRLTAAAAAAASLQLGQLWQRPQRRCALQHVADVMALLLFATALLRLVFDLSRCKLYSSSPNNNKSNLRCPCKLLLLLSGWLSTTQIIVGNILHAGETVFLCCQPHFPLPLLVIIWVCPAAITILIAQICLHTCDCACVCVCVWMSSLIVCVCVCVWFGSHTPRFNFSGTLLLCPFNSCSP